MNSHNFFKKFNGKTRKLKGGVLIFTALLIFFLVFYYTFLSQRVMDEEVPNYADLKVDSYQKYKNSISDTRRGIKNLIENKQLEQINDYNDFFKDMRREARDNPFAKFF